MTLIRREIKAARAKQLTDLERSLTLAATRLGDEDSRKALILRLVTPGAPSRFQALQDCVYVGDRSLAAHFGPALADHTDVFSLNIPEEPPEHARVLDVAIHVMGQLGLVLTFQVEALARFSRENVEESQRIVAAMTR